MKLWSNNKLSLSIKTIIVDHMVTYPNYSLMIILHSWKMLNCQSRLTSIVCTHVTEYVCDLYIASVCGYDPVPTPEHGPDHQIS